MTSGSLIVISAPSGGGKSSIAREIMRRNPGLAFSVSATTRPRRSGEEHGREYYFLDRMEFERRVAAGRFAEWEEIYGDLYGTLHEEVDKALKEGRHLLFDVDVKGALSLKHHYPGALLIFIAPPDRTTLEARLRGRHTEDEQAIRTRLERVPMELAAAGSFDHRVVNDDLQRAVGEVDAIVKKHLHASIHQ